jgi:PAS domain S-box-containing protein
VKCHVTNAFCVWMIVLSIMSSPTHAKEFTVRVGVYDNAPIVFPDKNGGYSGLSVEMLQYIATKEGWKLEYVYGSLAECLDRLEQGDIDIQVYIAYSKARTLIFDFSQETLLSNWGVIYTRPNSGIETIFDLEGKRVALMKDSIHPPVFMKLVDSFGVHIDTTMINDHLAGFRLVNEKKADAVVVNRIFGLTHSRQFNVEKTTIIFNPIEIRYAAPKGKNGDLLAVIDTHLKALKADRKSIFYQSFNKAFNLNAPFASVPKWIYWGFSLLLALTGLLGLTNSILNRRVRKRTEELHTEIDFRKQAEKELLKSETFLSTIVENIPNMIFIKDAKDLRFIRFNKAGEDLLGYSREEMIGKNDYDFFPKEAAEIFIGKDREVLNKKAIFDIPEEPIQTKQGKRILHTKKISLLDKNGQPEYLLGISEDITERKQAEVERLKLQAQVSQAQKMESIGQLAGGIAHDFNNVLYPIIGFTQMSIEDLPKTHPIQENLQDILSGANRARDLVKKILLFSRQKKQELKSIIIRPVIEEAIELLRSTIPTNIDIQTQLYDGKDYILCDETEIHELVMNLCTNAYHGIEDIGKIKVSLNKIQPDPDLDLPLGEYLCLSVSDNGVGIPEDIIDKIFEPYYTTKGVGKGTGMGLSIVHGIVKNYKGEIEVISRIGKGTHFNIFLPVTTKIIEIAQNQKKENPLFGTERILFVDDEKSIVKLGIKALERFGYTVTGVQDSIEALTLFKSKPEIFDLVITDMAMPVMEGTQLAQKIFEMRPKLPIVICSGFSEKINQERASGFNIKAFIDKPISIKELTTKIREILDQSDGGGD